MQLASGPKYTMFGGRPGKPPEGSLDELLDDMVWIAAVAEGVGSEVVQLTVPSLALSVDDMR